MEKEDEIWINIEHNTKEDKRNELLNNINYNYNDKIEKFLNNINIELLTYKKIIKQLNEKIDKLEKLNNKNNNNNNNKQIPIKKNNNMGKSNDTPPHNYYIKKQKNNISDKRAMSMGFYKSKDGK
tara:strand:- start:82 stop:456 length:375 start_codon:yes stop_codon:yes gene_type:complete